MTYEEDEDPIVRRIEAQRTSEEAFLDDGARNARKLAAYLRINDDLSVSEEIIEAIDAVGYDEYTESDFAAYVQAVEQLKKRFCKARVQIDPRDQAAVEECILTLASPLYVLPLAFISTKSNMSPTRK